MAYQIKKKQTEQETVPQMNPSTVLVRQKSQSKARILKKTNEHCFSNKGTPNNTKTGQHGQR